MMNCIELIDEIYNFDEHIIILEIIENKNSKISSGAYSLLKLDLNLYNGYETDVKSTFQNLDDNNFELALNAIKTRFNKINSGSFIHERK